MNTDHPQIPESLVRSVLLEILAPALKRWRYEGTGPDYVKIEGLGCATIFLFFLSSSGRTHGYFPCGPQWRKLVELFKKKDSKFYWYDFKVRSRRQEESRKDCCCVRFR